MTENKITIIAEIGHNHNGNIGLACDMIVEAKNCGADYVKFQLYDTDKIKKPYQSRYSELKYAEIDQEQFHDLNFQAKDSGIKIIYSIFDISRFEWFTREPPNIIKIASRSINEDFVKKINDTKVIASLGAVNNQIPEDLKEKPNFDFLWCLSEYPAYITNDIFPKNFVKEGYAGFSDHTIGCYWAREAIKRGAKIIEKHFTLDKNLPGYNQKGSADPTELKDLVRYARQHERGINY